MKRALVTPSVSQRFWAKVNEDGECWVWTGSKIGKGYGQFTQGGTARQMLAHRWAYEAMVDLIPEGLELDHLCRNKACVNPEHLEPVTHAVNIERNPNAINNTARLVTNCPQGHEYDEANTRWYRNKRHCRACGRAATAAYRARRHAA
jgi:hypothetical protein